MSLLNSLMNEFGDDAIQQISSQLGTDSAGTQQAIGAALPMIMGALGRNAASEDGAQALTSALSTDHDGGILNDLSSALSDPNTASVGSGILGHVLGSQQDNIVQGLSQSSGLDAGSTGKLMQMLAPVVMGALGKQQSEGGLDAAGIASLLGGESEQAASQLGGLSQLLDMDGDGSIADDVMSLGSKVLGGLFSKS